MIFELHEHEACTVITATGRLNVNGAPELKAAVNEAIAAGHRRLVLDLAGTDFMDSSGMGAIVSSLKSARGAGGDLRIAQAGEQLLMVLRLTRLDRILTPYASVQEAFGEA
ncbi:MAG TPA: STAS domain-containing protein [Sinomonas sp.]|nr:STAS domain-containing protein [Sinomonas sp.]